jgi:hypothetical protein
MPWGMKPFWESGDRVWLLIGPTKLRCVGADVCTEPH